MISTLLARSWPFAPFPSGIAGPFKWIRALFLIGIVPHSVFLFSDSIAESPPLNVLFLSVDDMRDWAGFLDGYKGEVHTPHMDRLAAQGVNFTNAHCPSPVCNPSRTAVMTGLMPSTTGVYDNSQWLRPNRPDIVTLPQFFMRNGYRVIGAGKSFHHTAGNNPPDQWHEYKRTPWADFPWNRSNKLNYPWTEWQPPPPEYPFSKVEYLRGRDERDWGVLPGLESEYDDAVIVDYAIDFLGRHDGEIPFFLSVGTFHPHLPWYVPQRFRDLYADAEIRLPETRVDDLDDIPEIPRKWAAFRRDEMRAAKDAGEWEEAVRCYLASISFADAQIGRMLEALEKSPFARNTLVVLWSDHGWHLGEKDHWTKKTLWEASTRVPFIVKGPGIDARQRSRRPVNLVSIFPTFVDLLGLESDVDFDGPSLAPLLRNPRSKWRHVSLTDFGKGNTAVRDERWRYILYSDGSEELYDLKKDPNEWTNLANEPNLQHRKKKLASHLPKSYGPNVPSKSAFDFDPDRWTFTNKKTGKVVHGANP